MADEQQQSPELTPYQIHLLRLVYAGRSEKYWTWYNIAFRDITPYGERIRPTLNILIQKGLVYTTEPTLPDGKFENYRLTEAGEALLRSLPPDDENRDRPKQ